MKSAQERAEKAVEELVMSAKIDWIPRRDDERAKAASIILRETNLAALVKCAEALGQLVESEPGTEDWLTAKEALKELNQSDIQTK